jgi:hypothetical protein
MCARQMQREVRLAGPGAWGNLSRDTSSLKDVFDALVWWGQLIPAAPDGLVVVTTSNSGIPRNERGMGLDDYVLKDARIKISRKVLR